MVKCGFAGGHFVQGHVDGAGVIRTVAPDGDSLVFEVETTPDIIRLIVRKGTFSFCMLVSMT